MNLFKRFLSHRKNETNIDPSDIIGCSLPWKGNDIYLEDRNKQVKAVCSSPDIARALAKCVECYSSVKAYERSGVKAYGKFIQDAYYLYVAMSNAKIPVDSVGTMFVEKAFHQFCVSLGEIIARDGLSLPAVGVNSECKTAERKDESDGLESIQQKR